MIIDKESIENLVGTKISKIDLYQKAFTHKSSLKENDDRFMSKNRTGFS